MSIETTMTLTIAAGILVTAAVMNGLFRGALWLAVKISGREFRPWVDRAPALPPNGAIPPIPVTVRIGRTLQGAGALVVFVLATVAGWLGAISLGLAHAFAALGRILEEGIEWLAPRTVAGSRTAYAWARPRVARASATIAPRATALVKISRGQATHADGRTPVSVHGSRARW